MQISFKKAVAASVLAVAALGAVSARADVATPGTGNGELTLFVHNNVTGESYARGLQIQLDAILQQGTGPGQSGGAYTGPVALSYSFAPIGPDLTLTQFLSGGATGDFTWGILAGDSSGNNNPATPRRFVLATNVDLTSVAPPSSSGLANLATAEITFFDDLNLNLPDTAGSSVRGLGSAGGLWDAAGSSGELADTLFNVAPNSAKGALTSVLNFYLLSTGLTSTGAQGNAAPARVWVLNDVQLDADGTLHMIIASTPQVPLPAAVWLLGSGLLGLVGVGRRRRAVAAAA